MSTPQTQSPAAIAPAPALLPFPRILCAVDGSRGAAEAIGQALALAGEDAQLTFLSVTDVFGYGPTRMASLGPRSADHAIEAAHRAAREAGVKAATLVRHAADPRVAILDEARHHDLVVLGTHGQHRAAGIFLGSIPAVALHTSPVPVLLARPAPYGAEFPRDILVAADGSPAMRPIVALAAAVARRHGGRVTLAHIDANGDGGRLELAEEAAALELALGEAPRVLDAEGHVPTRLAELARDLPAALLVTGSRGVTGVRALGSVSERAGMIAPCSVLVVRH